MYVRRRSQSPEARRGKHVMRNFGITVEQYQQMLSEQNGVCAICKNPETCKQGGVLMALAVDHDHATGRVRQLLCRSCNVGLGNYNDDPDLLQTAAEYLRRHRG